MSEINATVGDVLNVAEKTNEICKKCKGNGYFTVYDEMDIPCDVECCPIDDYDYDDDWEANQEEADRDRQEYEEFMDAKWEEYRLRNGADSVGPFPGYCSDCEPGPGARRCGHW